MSSESGTWSQRETRRVVNEGAEKWLGEKIPVLDHGFVYLVDYMGDDRSVEQAARVSYGNGTRSASETKGLVRYLRRHHHTTPFEMAETKFHMKLPIFVARQVVRHRTANINEISARYSILKEEFHIPEAEVICVPPVDNKQGRGGPVDPEYAEKFRQDLIDSSLSSGEFYNFYLNDDGAGDPKDMVRQMVARETSREFLPLNTYTEWYWKIDLHNLFHFLKLRMDPHAQYEVRQYADAMAQIVSDAYPISWEAFVDYEVENVDLTRLEKEALSLIIANRGIEISEEEFRKAASLVGMKNKRETTEMIEKFKSMGLSK